MSTFTNFGESRISERQDKYGNPEYSNISDTQRGNAVSLHEMAQDPRMLKVHDTAFTWSEDTTQG